jgi:hypothetical protein
MAVLVNRSVEVLTKDDFIDHSPLREKRAEKFNLASATTFVALYVSNFFRLLLLLTSAVAGATGLILILVSTRTHTNPTCDNTSTSVLRELASPTARITTARGAKCSGPTCAVALPTIVIEARGEILFFGVTFVLTSFTISSVLQGAQSETKIVEGSSICRCETDSFPFLCSISVHELHAFQLNQKVVRIFHRDELVLTVLITARICVELLRPSPECTFQFIRRERERKIKVLTSITFRDCYRT